MAALYISNMSLLLQKWTCRSKLFRCGESSNFPTIITYIPICFMYVCTCTPFIALRTKYFLLNAAVVSKEAEGSIRLLGGSGSHEGQVEMYLLGQWTTVCNVYTWDMSDAAVACQQLGYSGAVAAPRGSNFNVEVQRRSYGVSNIQCNGYEVNITYCEKHFYERCSRNIAGVICSPAC